jgi:hypothetical protein
MLRLIACLAACAALAGCNANYAWAYRGGFAGAPPPGATGTASLSYTTTSSSSAAGAMVVAIGLLSVMSYSDSGAYHYVNGNPFAAITPSWPPPPLDPERRVNEQDCTKPIEDWSANLRCK